jgi:hypothetical protein
VPKRVVYIDQILVVRMSICYARCRSLIAKSVLRFCPHIDDFLINWGRCSCSFYHSLPPVTKAYGTLCFLTTVAYQLHLLNPEWIYLDFALVTKKFQVRQELQFSSCGKA